MIKLSNSPITQETGPQASAMPLPTWRVKLSDGTVYGPIELGELQIWAEECRLAPGDQISSDTGDWANAESLPELAMQWMVEMASGEIFGPVHLHAVVDFFHSRLVLPSSRLTNRVTGNVATVADLVLPLIRDAARDESLAGAPVVADNAASADRLIKFNQNTSTTPLPPQHKEELQLYIEQLQATVDESESRIKQLKSDLDSQQAQTLKFRDDKAALEKTYLVKLEDAQKNHQVAANALEKAEAQVQTLRDDQVRREKESGDGIRSLSDQTQDSSGEIAEKNNVISRLEAELIKTRADFEADMRDIQDRLGRATSDYDSALNNLREKEASLSAAVRERDLALQSARELTQRYQTRLKELDVQIGELAAHKQTSEREIEMRQNEIERLNAALAKMEQHGADAARDWEAVRSEKNSQIQTLTRQIEALTADQTAMRSVWEQNHAQLEEERQETRKLVSRAKELTQRIAVPGEQIQNVSENLAASEDEVAGQREPLEEKTGEHVRQETQLQTRIEELSGRRNELNQEMETVRGELTRREADIESMSQRVISMENSVTEAGNEAEQQKVRCQGIQKQLDQANGEFKQREMTEKAPLDQKHTAPWQRPAESEKVAETIRVELHQPESDHQAALKESQDGINKAMHSQALNGETEAMQAIVKKRAQMEKAFAAPQDTAYQLKSKMAQDHAPVQDFRERTAAILKKRQDLESRLASAPKAL